MYDDDVYKQVAELHIIGIDQGFLSSLGKKFLVLLYKAIDESDDSVLIVENENGVITGFISGGHGMRSIYKRMILHFPQLMLALLPQILNPLKLWGILEILTHQRHDGINADISRLPHHELFSVVVAPNYRGKGIAEKLYSSLCRYFSEHGVNEFKILVGKNLEAAHHFYQRMGAKAKLETNLHKGDTSIIYIQRI
ncbi:MAG: GNAT family N-acetyltransferase [Sphingomonadales bacterium]|jgi:ribosomal protein S18 acetylase RimI-like enzyme